MRKITQDEIANRIGITSRTLRNWEKEKPELLRLVKKAIDSESVYLEFWKLMDNTASFVYFDDLFIDLYLKFLNNFRKNITMSSKKSVLYPTDITVSLVNYLITKDKSDVVDPEFINRLTNFLPKEDMLNLFFLKGNKKLSEYILRNTIDDFELLVTDSMGIRDKLEEAIKISLNYIIFKYEPNASYSEKDRLYGELKKKIGLKSKNDINKKKLFDSYIKVKDEFSLPYLHDLYREEPDYKFNTFYVPGMIQRLEKKGT